jgi:enoyl-[acyl-carrier-protein] reductase (NADH)
MAQVPLRRPDEPAEVAAVVVFLASEHASAVTAAVLTVDGGAPRWTCQRLRVIHPKAPKPTHCSFTFFTHA